MCGHIYKCGFTYISVSVIFTAIYRFLTQTAPYTNTERRAVVLAMRASGTRTPHTQTCGARALHVILFEGASRSLVPRPSPAPVFDRLQYAKTEPETGSVFAYWKRSKTGAGEGLGTRLLRVRQLHFTNVRQLHALHKRSTAALHKRSTAALQCFYI